MTGNKKGSLREPLGSRPPPGWGVLDEVGGSLSQLADCVEFVESMDTGGAGQSVPVVTATFAPAV